MKSQKSNIYYDGLCILCSREIELYKKNPDSHVFNFVDITSSGFDPLKEGLDPYEVHRVLHVKTQDNTILTGVDAFVFIWSQMPRYELLSKIANISLFRPILEVGYKGFARIRRFLPKRKKLCQDSPYCESKDKNSPPD